MFEHTYRLAKIMSDLQSECQLDDISLRLLQVMIRRWRKDKPVRITDLVKARVASRVTTFDRVSRVLHALDYIRYADYPSDARVRLIVAGPRMDWLEELVQGTGIKGSGGVQGELF